MAGFDPVSAGAGFVVRETLFANAGLGVKLASADPSRVAILFGASGVSSGQAVSTALQTGMASGLNLPTTGYVELTWARHGPLPAQAWYTAVAGPVSYVVFEVFYRPKEVA